MATDPADGQLEPRGEDRRATSWSHTRFTSTRDEEPYTRRSAVGTDVSVPPEKLDERHTQYVETVPLVKAPLQIFSDAVTEPGWTVAAEIDGGEDEELTEALDLWGRNCAIHAAEPGHDIMKLVETIPELRRGKGAVYFEKVGTRPDPDALAALMPLKPSTISVHTREDQPILVQPDDDVDAKHARTDDGRAAAYVQYGDDLNGYSDETPNPFAVDDLVKIVYNAPEGSALGTPLWVTIREHIDGLYQKLRDRNASIRINGQPWRVIQNENWSEREAQDFLNKHFEGEYSTWVEEHTDGEGGSVMRNTGDGGTDRDKDSFASRVDAVPHSLEIDEYPGTVPDIDDSVMDDIQAIFSVMPVSRFKIAYEEDINQFVVEPQAEKDDRNVVKERQVIRDYIEPLFQEKAAELRGGEYDGEVTWKLEQPTDENPLERESFDADDFATTADAFISAGAPKEVVYWLAGVDPDEFEYTPEDGDRTESDLTEIDEDDVNDEQMARLERMRATGGDTT